jgi:hypothetical protein
MIGCVLIKIKGTLQLSHNVGKAQGGVGRAPRNGPCWSDCHKLATLRSQFMSITGSHATHVARTYDIDTTPIWIEAVSRNRSTPLPSGADWRHQPRRTGCGQHAPTGADQCSASIVRLLCDSHHGSIHSALWPSAHRRRPIHSAAAPNRRRSGH